MSMNGIDIASYQAGINLSVVPCDFVIIKATQGVSYVNPDCNRAYQSAKSAGKCLGLYHYASGGGAVAEADFFLKNIENYIGEAILVLDWETDQNAAWGQGVAYAKAFMDRIKERTGINPLIYMSKAVCNQYNWSSVANADYGLWVAQYANYTLTGYQSAPWTDANGYGAWKSPAIFQYSSSGRLTGWGGNLDINVAYMDKATWNKYAGKKTTSPITSAKKPDGHNVHLYENNGNKNQKWILESEGEWFRFLNCATGEYLDTDGKAKSGCNLKTYKRSSSAGQLFKLVPVENKDTKTECYKIVSKANEHLVVDVCSNGTKNKTNIQLYNDNGSYAQRWFFRRDGDGYMIFHAYSLKALDGGGAL